MLKIANMSKDISDFATVEIIDIFDQTGGGNWWLNSWFAAKSLQCM